MSGNFRIHCDAIRVQQTSTIAGWGIRISTDNKTLMGTIDLDIGMHHSAAAVFNSKSMVKGKIMKRGLVVVAVAALVLLLATGAYADTVGIGLQEAGINGGALTVVAAGSGSAVFSGVYGTFDLNLITAAGTPPLIEPELSTTSVNASSSAGGTLTVFVTEVGVNTVPVGGFLSGFTSNVFFGSVASVTEQTFVDQGNGAFATTTPLGSQTFNNIGSTTAIASAAGLTAPYSETEVFTINATGQGNVNDTITLNQTPEPSTLTLFGSGLLGLAGLLRRRLIRV